MAEPESEITTGRDLECDFSKSSQAMERPEVSRGPGLTVLGPRAVRTLHAVADAWRPEGPVVAVGPAFDRALRHAGVPAVRRCVMLLSWLELSAHLARPGGGGFSWLPRDARRRRLERLRERARGPVRRAVAELLEGIEAAQSSDGA